MSSPELSQHQLAWLEAVGKQITWLFDQISDGHDRAECTIGQREIARKRIRLSIRVEVVDPGPNPLSTHSLRRVIRPD